MEDPLQAAEEALWQNVPNPFNARTTLSFTVSKARPVTLEIYTLLGQRVKTLLDGEELEVGRHSVVWDGRDASGQEAAGGFYLYRLRIGEFSATKKMLLVR